MVTYLFTSGGIFVGGPIYSVQCWIRNSHTVTRREKKKKKKKLQLIMCEWSLLFHRPPPKSQDKCDGRIHVHVRGDYHQKIKVVVPVTQDIASGNQRTIGPENAHLKPDLGVLSHNEMTLTLNIGQGHPRVIISTNYDGLESQMLHTKFHENWPASSGEEDF